MDPFNFADLHLNWLNHTVKNTFGSPDAFRGKVVADAGAGSGLQSRWMKESGAARVISRELSHFVDGIMKQNLQVLDAVNVIQCSIDHPPLRDGAVDGVVLCQTSSSTPHRLREPHEHFGALLAQAVNLFQLISKERCEYYSQARLGV